MHVQISGVSRGYLRRNSVELPELIARRLQDSADTEASVKAPAFRVAREENSVFPGDWEPLKGKTVKIYTVQPASSDPKETNARAKLNFATSLMRKFAADSSPEAADMNGAVVIFDSADGGIAAATTLSIQQLTKRLSEGRNILEAGLSRSAGNFSNQELTCTLVGLPTVAI